MNLSERSFLMFYFNPCTYTLLNAYHCSAMHHLKVFTVSKFVKCYTIKLIILTSVKDEQLLNDKKYI